MQVTQQASGLYVATAPQYQTPRYTYTIEQHRNLPKPPLAGTTHGNISFAPNFNQRPYFSTGGYSADPRWADTYSSRPEFVPNGGRREAILLDWHLDGPYSNLGDMAKIKPERPIMLGTTNTLAEPLTAHGPAVKKALEGLASKAEQAALKVLA